MASGEPNVGACRKVFIRQGPSAMQIVSNQEHVPAGKCHLLPRRSLRFIGGCSDATAYSDSRSCGLAAGGPRRHLRHCKKTFPCNKAHISL